MRTIALITSVLVATSDARADDDVPHCTIVEIDGRPHSIEVSEAFRRGARWAEYNCRVDSEQHVKEVVHTTGACDAKYAVKWVLMLGPRHAAKRIDMTTLCSKLKR